LRSILSIDVGKENIHIVEGSFLKDDLLIEKAASFKVPAGCFSGETISNPDRLSEYLMNAINNFGFSSKEAIITFDAYGAIIRDIALPNAKPNETTKMIHTEMIQTYHIPPTNVVQYKNIGKVSGDSDTQLINYRAAAIDEEIVEAYHNILTRSKLKPVAMDININAIDKLLKGDIAINKKILNSNSTMLLDFGATLTTVYIISQNKPIFYRQLDSGCGEIERIISEQTFASEKEIKKMKEDGFNFFSDNEDAKKYFDILRPFFYNLMDEIRKIIGFYASRSIASNVEQIYLFGGGSGLAGFTEYCEYNLSIPTEQIFTVSKVKLNALITPFASYLNALGALIIKDRSR